MTAGELKKIVARQEMQCLELKENRVVNIIGGLTC